MDNLDNDEMMNKFLRPETLFGTKFEGYLNEKGGGPNPGPGNGNNRGRDEPTKQYEDGINF